MRKRLKPGWPLVLAVCFSLYALYLVDSLIRSQQLLSEATERRLLSDGARQASAIASFFSDRRNEVSEIAERSEVLAYFTNKDLGMSDRYGLIANLAVIDEYLSQKNRALREIAYDAIALLDAGGAPVSYAGALNDLRGLQSAATNAPMIRIDPVTERFVISAPVFYKGQYRGQIVAVAKLATFRGTLLSQRQDTAYRELLLDATGTTVHVDPSVAGLPPALMARLAALPPDRLEHLAAGDGAWEADMLAMRSPIRGTSLSLVTLLQPEEILGVTGTNSKVFVLLGLVPVVLLFLTYVFERTRRREQALQVNVDTLTEEIRRREKLERTLNEKNRELQALSEKYQESAQQAAQANRAKSEFLATMSHEIRTPMNAILGMAQVLENRQLSDREYRECLQILLDSGNKLLALLNDILDLAKVESGRLAIQPTPVVVEDLAREAVALFHTSARQKGLELQLTSTLPPAQSHLIDEVRVRQMMSNLIGNAIKFTDNGAVIVRLALSAAESAEAPPLLEVSVTDTGIGIPEDKLNLLFQHFSQVDSSPTRRYGGSGLGLSIVQRLATLMGGSVGVSSRPGAGSTFWFKIPAPLASTAQPGIADAPEGGPVAVRRAGRVLVAEDDRYNQRVIELLLRKQGIETRIAGDGQAALQCYEDEPGFDLVFMDMQMPVMDGLEATRALRALEAERGWSRVPVVAFTGNAFAEDRENCMAAGMDDFMTKPVNAAVLHRMLDRWLPGTTIELPAPLPVAEPMVTASPPAEVFQAMARLRQLLVERNFDAVRAGDDIADQLEGTTLAAPFAAIRAALGKLDFPGALAQLDALVPGCADPVPPAA